MKNHGPQSGPLHTLNINRPTDQHQTMDCKQNGPTKPDPTITSLKLRQPPEQKDGLYQTDLQHELLEQDQVILTKGG